MFSFAKKTVFRDYREYTTDEIRDVASRLLNENRRDDWQHTQYVKHVSDGLQPYFKDCVGGCYENIDEMNMRDCGKVLLWCDNLHAVRKKAPPISKVVVPPHVSGDDVTTQKLDVPAFCESYAYYYDDRDAFHFKLLVDTLNRADKYTVFGARTGGIVKVSKQLGFTNMNFIEHSAYCRQMIDKQYGIKCVDDSQVDGVLIFFDTSHRADLQMYKYLGEDKSVLVYDHAPFYLGCFYLSMTGHTSDYRYATNLNSYLRVGSDLSPPIHPPIVDLRLFDQFEEVYIHTDVVHVYALLQTIDPLHKLDIRFFGDGSSKYNTQYVTSSNVRSKPALFLIDQDVGDLYIHFRRGDVVYSLCSSHIIDNKFMNENVALLCQVTPYEIYRLGFIGDEMTLYDMSLKNGFVVSQSNDFHVRTSRWYMLQDGANIRFSPNDGTQLSNVLLKKKHVLGYDMFCVARPCVLEFDCNAFSCNYECRHVHTVVVSEHGRCDYFSSLLLKFDLLSQYPQLFRLNVNVLASVNQTAEQRDMILMLSDRMVRKKFGWIFNPSGRLKMYAPDVLKLKEMLTWCRTEMCDFFPNFFGLAMHYELDGDNLVFKGFKCAVEDGKRMITCIDHLMPQVNFGTYRVVLYDKVLGRAFSTVFTYCCCEPADGVSDDRDFGK